MKQLGSMLGVSFAAVCCLGVSWALAALAAIGAGFLINDAILIPLYLAFIAPAPSPECFGALFAPGAKAARGSRTSAPPWKCSRSGAPDAARGKARPER